MAASYSVRSTILHTYCATNGERDTPRLRNRVERNKVKACHRHVSNQPRNSGAAVPGYKRGASSAKFPATKAAECAVLKRQAVLRGELPLQRPTPSYPRRTKLAEHGYRSRVPCSKAHTIDQKPCRRKPMSRTRHVVPIDRLRARVWNLGAGGESSVSGAYGSTTTGHTRARSHTSQSRAARGRPP
ncbi:hypothetical protein BDU57DRAFT_526957 [Ampelomyces quisqualis]|uniref:Uncharacterized protein n=1 Tax=Ampelomyces quisqualis TaxID=50730 RepID=A0A6A5QTU3_AMPQU|nr:hypothetical protein BDU57DRAFT_526957 [Ampelomyces quisqualis]